MIRFFDLLFSVLLICFLLPIFIFLLAINSFHFSSPLFFQARVGKNKKTFTLIKYRSMKATTQSMPTHMLNSDLLTKWGKFLRSSKLDELPQLWNVLVGDMSLVGPRPCLTNQRLLISERSKRNIFDVKPGITGMAQVNCIDMSDPKLLAKIEETMLSNFGLKDYFRFLFLTLIGKGSGDNLKR